MKGRMEGDYIIYQEGTKDDAPVKLHLSFANQSEDWHLAGLLYSKKRWDQTFEVSTFWRTEEEIAWEIENHRVALTYEYGNTQDSITKKLEELDEKQFREDLGLDMDER
ncbi:hypothetical protein ACTJJ0_22220 [Chitinophaga sp. 22321]|uniref:hypothetical protein n=1 Tax=Chitinophaga sp. 22321 TaxID=3453909 RepID=UPI003F87330C